ncbi:MAG: multicopper oxidase domain-containing protein [Gammaproteobacteria bacterium]
MKKISWLVLLCVGFFSTAFAAERVVNLVVGYKTVSFAGKAVKAIAVNNQIPAPTLHFKQNDHVIINVYNQLDETTTIHWHGVLVPWQMDGVEGVSQKGIPPNGVFHYQFILKQAGTYWYHSHKGLQEQQGLYGSFLIDPPTLPRYRYTKDFVIVLSDWSNTAPQQILLNLKKEGDFYSPRFPLQPSLTKFIHDYSAGTSAERKKIMSDYKMMQQMRMSIYDISDVAYDSFLLNGQPKTMPWTARVKVGDVVRLRFIGAASGTIFHVKIPGSTLQMVHVEGNDVKQQSVDDFNIAPGETYDVLVKIKKNKPYLIYAESADTVGAAFGALTTADYQYINYQQVTPFPEPLPVIRNSLTMDHPMSMSHSEKMVMQTEPSIIGDRLFADSSIQKTIGTKYQNLTAAVKTNDPNKPVYRVIKMELYGYMDRFIWFINGVPEYKAHPIILESNKRYRIVFTNPSMMHHPMHIHGHWFILRNGHGRFDPLLHTIDVPPGATVTADIDTDASGQWIFHCHLLYHMVTGMARVLQYASLIELTKKEVKPQDVVKQTAYVNRPIVRVDEVRPIDSSLVRHPMAHPMNFYFANFLELGEDPFHNTQQMTFKGLYGRDYNKLELFTNDAEVDQGRVENADVDIFYWHLLDQFWSIKGGGNYVYRPAKTPYWQPGIGLEGLMPYFIETNLRGYTHSGSIKIDVEFSRDTQITNNFFMGAGIRGIFASKTVTQAEYGSGVNQTRYSIRPYYRLMPGLNVFAEYEHQRNYGVFKKLQISDGESAVQNVLTFGLSLIF